MATCARYLASWKPALAGCLALLMAVAAGPGAASADQTDPRLPGLFARLKAAVDPVDARTVETTIWALWMITGTEDAIQPFRKGMEALSEGRVRDSLDWFDQAVAAAPDFAEGWNKRATAHYLLGNLEESAADVARTLALEPRHFGALAGLGLIRRDQGQEAAALAAFERGLAVNPHMARIRAAAEALRIKVKGRDT